jgi:hypothetical protein
MKNLFVAILVSFLAAQALANTPAQGLAIEQVMTPDEMQKTGVASLNATQRQVLNDWLNRYTLMVVGLAKKQSPSTTSAVPAARNSCSPAIESTISGDIEGWSGDTIFKLDNGQIWQQAAYDYTYFYEYRPDVTIYQTSAGCRMKVEDETETVLVKRIK